MMRSIPRGSARQRGAALVIGLLLLMILSTLAISGMSTSTLEMRIAGNAQDAQDAFQAAETGVDRALNAPGYDMDGEVSSGVQALPNGSNYESVTRYRMSGPVPGGGFDLGIGALHLLTRGDEERRLSINAIGPVWDGNEVWLVTGGGALVAAFPEAYATVFSGFYIAFFLFLAALIFRAVAIEFRSKLPMRWWRTLWDVNFSLGSLIAGLLLGVALGNIAWGIRHTCQPAPHRPLLLTPAASMSLRL